MEPEQKVATGNDYTDGNEKERKTIAERDDGRKEEEEWSEEELERGLAKGRFLAWHRMGNSVSKAARVAGVDRRTVYRWRDRDPEFAKAWKEARAGLVEDLEMEAYDRAFKGNDRLLMFLLKSYKPVTYGQGQQQGKSGRGKAKDAKDLVELVEKVREWK